MDRIGSDLQESLSNTFLSTIREVQDSVSDAPKSFREFGQIRGSAQGNQLALTKQIKSINESVVSTNASSLRNLNTKSSSQHKKSHVNSNVQDNHKHIISGSNDIVSQISSKVAIFFSFHYDGHVQTHSL